jgi:hypothetical protein
MLAPEFCEGLLRVNRTRSDRIASVGFLADLCRSSRRVCVRDFKLSGPDINVQRRVLGGVRFGVIPLLDLAEGFGWRLPVPGNVRRGTRNRVP